MRDWMILPRFGEIRQSHTPGKCAKCGTSDPKRRVVGSGIKLTQPGVAAALVGEIQFCDECVYAAGRLVGMVDAERSLADRNVAQRAGLTVNRLERRIAKLEAALEALTDLKAIDSVDA
jgi:hypothetical protein